jgi:hypothetical protein
VKVCERHASPLILPVEVASRRNDDAIDRVRVRPVAGQLDRVHGDGRLDRSDPGADNPK